MQLAISQSYKKRSQNDSTHLAPVERPCGKLDEEDGCARSEDRVTAGREGVGDRSSFTRPKGTVAVSFIGPRSPFAALACPVVGDCFLGTPASSRETISTVGSGVCCVGALETWLVGVTRLLRKAPDVDGRLCLLDDPLESGDTGGISKSGRKLKS